VKVLVEDTGGRSALGRLECRWENDIIMHIQEVEWVGFVNWIAVV
jgi:hypothetical protein